MTTTTMHFGPEWMRNKQQASTRPQAAPSPPPVVSNMAPTGSHAPPGAASYSALVAPVLPPQQDMTDTAHPFKYSKEEILRIWKEGGGRGSLPIEVERWEGIVREIGGEPIGVKETSDMEKKLFASSINSELRRRQSSDYLVQGERPKLHQMGSSTGNVLREGFTGLVGRRRRGDSSGADQPPLTLPRKQSWSSTQTPLLSPSLTSPRARIGVGIHTSGFDGILNTGDNWNVSKRRASIVGSFTPRGDVDVDAQRDEKSLEIKEEDEEVLQLKPDKVEEVPVISSSSRPSKDSRRTRDADANEANEAFIRLSLGSELHNPGGGHDLSDGKLNGVVQEPSSFASIEWSYLDPSGNVQGPFRADTMQTWYDQQYFTDNLRMKRTHIDSDWFTVAELKRRAQEDKIYLSPLSDTLTPPGLSRRPAEPPFRSHMSGTGQNGTVFESPYQPIPQYSGRNSTLDSYLNSVSNSSSSPASSFGTGGFGTTSITPDVLPINSRATGYNFATDMQFSGRPGSNGFAVTDNPPAIFMPRRVFDDSLPEPPTAVRAFHRDAPGQSSSSESPTVNSTGMASIPWQGPALNDSQKLDGSNHNPLGSAQARVYHHNGLPMNMGTAFDAEPYFGIPATHFPKGSSYNSVQTASSHDGSVGNGSQSSALYGGSGFGAVGSGASQSEYSHLPGRDVFSGPIPVEPDLRNGQAQQPAQSPGSQYAVHQHSLPPLSTAMDPSFGHQQTLDSLLTTRQSRQPQTHLPPRATAPWGTPQEPTLSRPRPFEAQHPTANNTIVRRTTTPSQPSPWPRVSTAISTAHEGLVIPLPVDDGWSEFTEEPQSLTFNHVSQHNQLQQGLVESADRSSPVKNEETLPPLQPIASATNGALLSNSPPTSSPVVGDEDPIPRTTITKRRASAAGVAQSQAGPLLVAKSSTIVAQSSQSKAAWSIEDDIKKPKLPSATVVGLREIQEAEKKKQDARKVAEKEKERVVRASAPSQIPAQEAPIFTATWGLPTSQVGLRPSNNNFKESATPGPSQSSSAAWTSTSQPGATKKTMKEIQEEEERRKKLTGNQKETVAAAAKRAYAESATKNASVSQTAVGGSWTTVGVGGKASASTVAAVRPSVTTHTSSITPSASVTSVRSVNGLAATVRSPSSPQVPKASPSTPKPSTPKVEEEPRPPSSEFMKWLRDSLRGLSSSVQFEDIAHVLLSFPLDPDPSTVELIAETVYGASTTMDGRRFASEFIVKRKADAAVRPKGAGSAANGKPTSLAEVVKTQPKPTQSEWGYKVVKKKGKGGRA